MIYCLSKPIKEQWYANANVFFIISSMNSHTRKTYVNSTNKLAITNEYSSDRYTMQNQNIRIPNQLTRNAKPSSFNNEPSENAIDMQTTIYIYLQDSDEIRFPIMGRRRRRPFLPQRPHLPAVDAGIAVVQRTRS